MKIRFIVLLVFLFTSVDILLAQNNFLWVKNGGGSNNDRGKAICTGINGNIYVTGIAESNATFGSYTLNTGTEDIFIVKYDVNGNVLWAKMAGSDYNQEGGYGICTDASGNCYITGVIRGTAYFDNDIVISNGRKDIFIAKYDTDGNVIWVKNIGGLSDDNANSIRSDLMNNIYITGLINGVAYFGNDSLQDTNNGGSDFFIAKYDNNGNFLWAKRAGGNYWDEGFDIDIDDKGNIYATGFFTDHIEFETIQLVNNGRCPFLVKYDSTGNVIWAKAPNPSFYAQGTAIAVFPEGGCIITGYFQTSIYFESHIIMAHGNEDIYIARYDKDGNLQWAKNAGSNKRDRAFGITADKIGNCFVTGKFEETALFDSYKLTSNGNRDVFIAKYNSTGNVLWAINSGGNSGIPTGYDETGNGITLNKDNNCFVIGTFKGTASFNPYSLKSIGGADIFVAKVNPNISDIAIEEINSKIKVFPNPNSGEFYIKSELIHKQDFRLEIFDLYGRTIYIEKLKDFNENEISKITLIENATGMYLLQILHGNQRIIKKLIIE